MGAARLNIPLRHLDESEVIGVTLTDFRSEGQLNLCFRKYSVERYGRIQIAIDADDDNTNSVSFCTGPAWFPISRSADQCRSS